MMQTTKYVGLDVHQATTVAAVREESGRIIAERDSDGCVGAPRVRPRDARRHSRDVRRRHAGAVAP